MPPPLPPIVLAFAEASLKLYVPELALTLIPVDVPLVFTWPLKVVEPVSVTPAKVTLDVPRVFNDRPVVPPLIVPPLIVTLPLPSEVSDTPVVAPVVLTLAKITPEPPTVTPLRLTPVAATPVVTF